MVGFTFLNTQANYRQETAVENILNDFSQSDLLSIQRGILDQKLRRTTPPEAGRNFSYL